LGDWGGTWGVLGGLDNASHRCLRKSSNEMGWKSSQIHGFCFNNLKHVKIIFKGFSTLLKILLISPEIIFSSLNDHGFIFLRPLVVWPDKKKVQKLDKIIYETFYFQIVRNLSDFTSEGAKSKIT
jgi:hypothetical protein